MAAYDYRMLACSYISLILDVGKLGKGTLCMSYNAVGYYTYFRRSVTLPVSQYHKDTAYLNSGGGRARMSSKAFNEISERVLATHYLVDGNRLRYDQTTFQIHCVIADIRQNVLKFVIAQQSLKYLCNLIMAQGIVCDPKTTWMVPES